MLAIEQLRKTFGPRVLFDDCTVLLPPKAKIAVYGNNGSGKTTLLNMICGLDAQDSGSINFERKTRCAYLPQVANPNPEPSILLETMSGNRELYRMRAELAAIEASLAEGATTETLHRHEALLAAFRTGGGFALEAQTARVLKGLGIAESTFSADPRQLSGGMRMRIELAKVLLSSAELMIFDEPTNHLDIEGLVFMESFLRQCASGMLFVTHDRKLLDSLPTHILHVHAGRVRLFPGNLSKYLEQVDEEERQKEANQGGLQKKIDKVEALVARFRAKASKAGLVRSRLKMLAGLYEEAESLGDSQGGDRSLALNLPEPPKSGNPALNIQELKVGYSGKALFHLPKLIVESGMRIAVAGVNGIGKSTLLKTLSGEIPAIEGSFQFGYRVQLGFAAQDPSLGMSGGNSVLSYLQAACPKLTPAEARGLLARFLFFSGDVDKATKVLSGGEKARLSFACLFGRGSNLLLLDEPTNHLDLSAKDALLTICSEFQGTILFVSHDRDFMNHLATHVIAINSRGESVFIHGNYDDFARYDAQQGFLSEPKPNLDKAADAKASSGAGETKSTAENYRELSKACEKARKALEKLEADMQAEAERVQELDRRMAEAGQEAFTELMRLQKEHAAHAAKHAKLEEEWCLKAEALEDLERRLKGST